MTDSDDTSSHTRPISVAELLAKNGTIGAPPVGGRRRRRRGNSDAVTVAELTGEIPIISADTAKAIHTESRTRPAPAEPVTVVEEPVQEPADDFVEQPSEVEPEAEPDVAPELTEAEADYQAHLEQRDVDPDPLDFAPPPRRPQAAATGFASKGGGAEEMSPDPVAADDDMLDFGPDVDFSEVLDKHASNDEQDHVRKETPSYLRSGSDTLFGGQSVADDLARRGPQPGPEDIDLGDDDEESDPAETDERPAGQGGSAFVRGLWVVAQCVLAVAFGAGLFIGFDQLWRWNTIVALVLLVLVILGLVVGVRVVRKTEDIGSTLIAVEVGALVTLGPLALLQ